MSPGRGFVAAGARLHNERVRETDTLTRPAPPPDEQPRRRRGGWLTVLGVLMLVTGMTFLGLYVWDAYLNPVMDTKAAQQRVDEVRKLWGEGRTPSSKIPDNAVALLRIPEFGDDVEVAVMTGTSEDALNAGVGWFDHTAAPGAIGNFAVAGHRGASGPFVQLLDLKPGARVVVETRKKIFIYALTSSAKDLTVDKSETWVIDPVPTPPGTEREAPEPTQALITLVTCRNFFHSPERSIAFGELIETVTK